MEQDVYCQMAGESIPEGLCASEQGKRGCQGCKAPTRRCRTCGKLNEIVESIHGICILCLKKEEEIAQKKKIWNKKILVQGERTVAALRARFIEIREHLGSRSTAPSPSGDERPSPPPPPPPKILKHPRELFERLCDHHSKHGDERKLVDNPIGVLQVLARLTRDEVCQALKHFQREGWVEPLGGWSRLRITDPNYVFLKGLPEESESTFREDADEEESGTKRQPETRKNQRRGWEPVGGRDSWLEEVPRRRPGTLPLNPPSFSEAYRRLLGKATNLGGTLYFRGAAPYLQIQFGITPQDAIRILEKLKDTGHLEPRGGWGTTVLRTQDLTIIAALDTPHLDHVTAELLLGEIRKLEVKRDRLIEQKEATERVRETIEAQLEALRRALEVCSGFQEGSSIKENSSGS